jgi:taurine dioxygenase
MAQGKVCLAADVSVVAMTPDLGAEIRGVDLSAPLSDGCFGRILDVFYRYCVVFLRNQELDARLLARFAARFGDAELTPADESPLPGLAQVSVIGASGAPAGPGAAEPAYWHSDRSYDPAPPAATLLYALHDTDGGSIEFVNMYSVFNALAAEKRLLVQKLRGVHERGGPEHEPAAAGGSVALAPETRRHAAEHPLVRVHPETAKKALYVAKDVVTRASGMREEDGRRLLEQLEAFATQPRFIYAHRWRKGDVLIWDNRCTLHRMASLEGAHDRTLYRIRVRGEVPVPG